MAVLLIPIYVLGLWLELNPIKYCKIFVDGKVVEVETRKTTVKELLAQESIALGALDKVEPKLEVQLGESQVVKINRIKIRRVEKEQEVPFKVVIKKDANLKKGVKKVIVKGKKGTKVETYEILSVDGVDNKVELVRSKELLLPRNQLVAIGTKKEVIVEKIPLQIRKGSRTITLSRGGKLGRVLYLESTAYTHTGNRTATGIWPNKGIVAVDPSVIPLGTRLYVEGYGYAVAADTGGAIKGGIIDVFFNNRSECIKWGRRRVEVRVIK